MYFLHDHLIEGTFVNCYADTDSMALATTRTRPFTEGMSPEEELRAVFDPIVKPEMRQSWEENWMKWFVTTDAVEDERFPGKLKRKFIFSLHFSIVFFHCNLPLQLFIALYRFLGEFQFTNGTFVALGPKSYFSLDEDSQDVKMGSKGIPHSARLTMNMYLETLYGKGSHYVEMRSLRLNRKRQMTRITGTKRGLSDIFLKYRIADDGITCSPLMKNNEYL